MRSNRSALCFLLSVILLGCDEELPPQNNPTNLFTSIISEQYQYNSTARPTQSSIDIYIVYKNLYDETLNDFASMKGTITIEWIVPPEERGAIVTTRTDKLTFDNLFIANKYDFVSNRLAIDPKDSIVLRYRWNMKTDDSTNIMTQVKYSVDRSCLVSVCGGDVGYRSVSARQQFRVSATFGIFQRGGTVVTSPSDFFSCWIASHCGEISPCDQPNPSNPCNIAPQL